MNKDLAGMVRMEEEQVSGPEVSTAWVVCGAQRTGPYSLFYWSLTLESHMERA